MFDCKKKLLLQNASEPDSLKRVHSTARYSALRFLMLDGIKWYVLNGILQLRDDIGSTLSRPLGFFWKPLETILNFLEPPRTLHCGSVSFPCYNLRLFAVFCRNSYRPFLAEESNFAAQLGVLCLASTAFAC